MKNKIYILPATIIVLIVTIKCFLEGTKSGIAAVLLVAVGFLLSRFFFEVTKPTCPAILVEARYGGWRDCEDMILSRAEDAGIKDQVLELLR